MCTATGIFSISPSMVMASATVFGNAAVAPILSKSGFMSTDWPFCFRSRKKLASAAMKRLGGVPATKSETSGLSPAVSCGTETAVTVFPRDWNSLTMVLSAAISLSFDHEW